MTLSIDVVLGLAIGVPFGALLAGLPFRRSRESSVTWSVTWSDGRDVVRPTVPTCTAIPSAWRKERWR